MAGVDDDLVVDPRQTRVGLDVGHWASESGQSPRIFAFAAANSSSVSTPCVCSAASFCSCAVESSSAGASGAYCGSTSPCEYDATYTALESIQPEVFALVLREGGARPERWIVVSKGNGTVAHKGHDAMPIGGSADRCVRSWLTGNIDAQACLDASEYLPPEPL